MASEKRHHINGENRNIFPINSGADNHYVDSELFPNIERMMR